MFASNSNLNRGTNCHKFGNFQKSLNVPVDYVKWKLFPNLNKNVCLENAQILTDLRENNNSSEKKEEETL